MRRLAAAALAVIAVAATPAEVVPDLETSGYFVESGSSADEQAVSAAVAEARFDGGELYVVVLADEPGGGATTFSDAVLDSLGGGTVFTVAPETVGFASEGDVWTVEQLDRAADASLDGGDDTAVVEIFVATLVGEPVGGEEPASSGGSLWPIVIVVVVIGGVVAFFVWRSSRNRKAEGAARLDEVRSVVAGKLDDVANDIIDLEDEVAASSSEQARTHYERASATYADALGAAERATTPAELLALSTTLDETIWELDCAEAILDGKPPPPKPEPPPVLPTPAAPSVAAPPGPIPGTDYVRRTSRRSSPVAPDLTQTLLTMMAAGALTGRGRGMPFGLGSSRTGGPAVRSSPRVRGGGRRRRG